MRRTPSGLPLRAAGYLLGFVVLELQISYLLRWDTAVQLTCRTLAPTSCSSLPPAISDLAFAFLLATAPIPILAFYGRKLWIAAPFGFFAHGAVVVLVLAVWPATSITSTALWLGTLDVALALVAAAFAFGVGPPARSATFAHAIRPTRFAGAWDAYLNGRRGPKGAPNRLANFVACAIAVSATMASTFEFSLNVVACSGPCLAPAPTAALTIGFGTAVFFGVLPIAAASDRRASVLVAVGLVGNTAAVFLGLGPAADSAFGVSDSELYPFAFFSFLWLLALTAVFYLVLSGRPVVAALPDPALRT
jgi:hypothetical protein